MRCFTNFFQKKCICIVLGIFLGVLYFGISFCKFDFVGWFTAVCTMVSAIGLILFSILTYENQKSNEFYGLFKLILDENNRLLKEIIESKKNKVLILNKNIIDLFKNNFLKDECNLRNKAQFEINFQKEVVKKIYLHHELKPYLITLFRLLKLISTSNKISDDDKREYYGLIRGLTPPHIQFLILFNSLGYRGKGKQPNYTDLLVESRFFEHLPITESWLTDVYSSGQGFVGKDECPFLTSKEVSLLEKYIFSGKVIDLQAFGQSIYLKQASRSTH